MLPSKHVRTLFFVFHLVLIVGSALSSPAAARRVALVIGNGTYQHTATLPNPANDARAIGATLRELGFDVVEGIDLDFRRMGNAMREFSQRLYGADVGLFFYAGHGLQVYGKNYLVPIDAQLQHEADLEFETVALEAILRQLEYDERTNLVFLDACRDNPLARNLARSMGQSRSLAVGTGLAEVESGLGTLIAYATQPGNVALDGEGKHSPFTQALLNWIGEPGLEVRQMMTRVRLDVKNKTNGMQIPRDESELLGDFYFLPQPSALSSSRPQENLDKAFWDSVKDGDDPDSYRAYLEAFPQGVFAPLARVRLRNVEPSAVPERTESTQAEIETSLSVDEESTTRSKDESPSISPQVQEARLPSEPEAADEGAIEELRGFLSDEESEVAAAFRDFTEQTGYFLPGDRFTRFVSLDVLSRDKDHFTLQIFYQYSHVEVGRILLTSQKNFRVRFDGESVEFVDVAP